MQPGVGARAPPVHAYLSFTDDAVHAAAGDLTQDPLDEVVQPLAVLALLHLQVPDAGASRRILLLRHVDLVVRHCFYNGPMSILPQSPHNGRPMVGGLENAAAC